MHGTHVCNICAGDVWHMYAWCICMLYVCRLQFWDRKGGSSGEQIGEIPTANQKDSFLEFILCSWLLTWGFGYFQAQSSTFKHNHFSWPSHPGHPGAKLAVEGKTGPWVTLMGRAASWPVICLALPRPEVRVGRKLLILTLQIPQVVTDMSNWLLIRRDGVGRLTNIYVTIPSNLRHCWFGLVEILQLLSRKLLKNEVNIQDSSKTVQWQRIT